MNTAQPVIPFTSYLAAKRTVDDRALNRSVYGALAQRLAQKPSPLRILEIGCGTGTMLARLMRWGIFDDRTAAGGSVVYHAIDIDAANISAANTAATHLPNAPGIAARFEAADLFALATRPEAAAAYDLVIAHAVLDLLALDTALPVLRDLLRPGGLGWFTLNFDGVTIFEPEMDPQLDPILIAAYHATMDARTGPAAHVTGRRLFTRLPAHGLPIIAAGASDWVVFPHAGAYPHAEALFLQAILNLFAQSLAPFPALDPAALDSWLLHRRAQIARAELTFIAHQFDFLVERPIEEIA